MEKQTIQGIDLYNFPGDITEMLYWMGENYIEYIIETLAKGFRKQDPMTEIISIHCVQKPGFETRVSESTHEIHGMKATFKVHVLVKDGSGGHWILSGENSYTASGLNTQNTEILADFDLENAEEA